MDATVTLKVTPAEFDIIRDSLREMEKSSKRIIDDKDQPPEARRFARVLLLKTQDILSKLR